MNKINVVGMCVFNIGIVLVELYIAFYKRHLIEKIY
jgi:hypothetical protein